MSAGVTAIYRKYIDRYYANPTGEFQVEEADMEKLRSLYIRSEISEGYYHKHNGADMITLDSPSYAGRDDKLAQQIRKDYLEADYRIPIQAQAVLHVGENVSLTLSKGTISVSAEGDCIQTAQKQPLSEESILKQLNKFGNTAFQVTDWKLDVEEDVFLPVKALNELRRKACELLEDALIANHGLLYHRTEQEVSKNEHVDCKDEVLAGRDDACVHVLVLTKEQAMSAANSGVERIYLDSGLCRDTKWLDGFLQYCCSKGSRLYLALPYMMRQRDEAFKQEIRNLLSAGIFVGILLRNIEEIGWLETIREEIRDIEIVTDAGLYIWNPEAGKMFKKIGNEYYIPYELNFHEIKELIDQTEETEASMTVYGRLPMMITANCIAKTGGACRLKNGEKMEQGVFHQLTDRYQKKFPVFVNCEHCYNVIYNTIPLSLHQNLEKLRNIGIRNFRLDFTTEMVMM